VSWLPLFRPEINFPDYIQNYLDQDFNISSKTPVSELEFVVIDAETTGLDKQDQLVTLGGVEVSNYSIDLSHVLDQRYEHQTKAEAATVHGELGKAGHKSEEQNFRELLEYVSNKIIIGHQVSFDIGKINQSIAAKYPGFKLANKTLDTFQLMMRLDRQRYERQVGGGNALQLDEICKEFGISVENRHTALGDAYMTAQVLLFILARLEARGVSTAGDLLR